MDRRTLLTVSTAACLCGAYEAYALFVSPLFSPHAEVAGDRKKSGDDRSPPKPPENRRQAEKHLADQPWAPDSKYQFRTEAGFFYFDEWEKIEQTGKVRFHPFAMIWRPQGHDPQKDPYTIISESALVEFAERFEVTNPRPGRVVGGALEGAVQIRGPEGLVINGKNFNFAEAALRIWSDHDVSFLYAAHKGHGQGLELDLIPAPGPVSGDKPAVSGVRTIRLRKEVHMELVSRTSSGVKADDTVFVDSQGNFEYQVEAHVAIFQKNVRVNRPTGGGKSDRLNCELLTLIFEPEESPAVQSAGTAEARPTPAGENGFDTVGGNLAFRRLRAEGPVVTVVSQRSDLEGWMNELTYDAQARVVALRDARRVRLFQQNNELVSPEITAVLDEEGQIERAVCRGAGKLFSFAKGTDRRLPRKKKRVEMAAEWQKQLHKAPDATTGLDLIEFEGRAVLNQAGRMDLQGDIVRIWVTPGERGGAGLGREKDERSATDDEKIQPKRMLALREVTFASPQIAGKTDRLEVWFDEGSLPSPPHRPGDGRAKAQCPSPRGK